MQAVEERLVREDLRLIQLLAPPFDAGPLDPGYIKGYLPGIRENGAQYTHAALWSVLATAMLGDGERAMELFRLLNPLSHADTAADVATYRVEPYVVAADVYTAQGQAGRGGWTWYTGSASWMYRVGLEALLGVRRRGGQLEVVPRVPEEWDHFVIEYRHGSSRHEIRVESPARVGREGGIHSVDGGAWREAPIALRDDGERHTVIIRPR
jgi:cyclic beta-1,2-glucan synthetase